MPCFMVLVFIDSLNALGLCCEICWDTYISLEISVKSSGSKQVEDYLLNVFSQDGWAVLNSKTCLC